MTNYFTVNIYTSLLLSSNFDEASFIRSVRQHINEDINVLGHNDDAIAIAVGNEFLVINIDGWVASSDRPEGLSLHACGFRAVANAVSDVIAKGAKPTGMIISLSMPKQEMEQLDDIIQGFVSASKTFNVPYLGGDMNTSTDIVIDVTAWGTTTNPIRRSNAQPGDNVYWLGPPLGKIGAALRILTQNWSGNREEALDVYGYPDLFPEFLHIPANASIDSSDGLARSLHLLSGASEVGIILDFELELQEQIIDILDKNGVEKSEVVFYGGEELGIVFTCPSQVDLPKKVIKLGTVTKEKGVFYLDKPLEDKGWDHLASD